MKPKIELQKRELFCPNCLTTREDGDNEVIEGVAIVCNVETVIFECDSYREVEVIDPSCISKEFIEKQDIKLNALHKRSLTFGRVGGNLKVEPREDSLAFSCTGTSDKFKETRALINDGVYTGCSFEFWPQDYAITERKAEDGKTEYVIRHTAFRCIDALTVAMQPAYEQTSVSAREIYQQQHGIEEPKSDEEREKELKKLAKVNRERTIAVLRSQFAAEDAEDAR